MKVNRVYKTIRPIRKFGNLIKDILFPAQSKHGWCRYPLYAKNKKEKELYMAIIIEHLDNRIKIQKL